MRRDDFADWVLAVLSWLFVLLVMAVSISVPIGYTIWAAVRTFFVKS